MEAASFFFFSKKKIASPVRYARVSVQPEIASKKIILV
jgi:hypothetical protein